MKKLLISVSLVLLLLKIPCAFSADPKFTQQDIQNFISHIFNDNSQYVSQSSHSEFHKYSEQQNPRATVVACSDSRVQTNVFHKSPVNDLFFVRNIGNQILSTQGSVEYGVRHLHTPVLLIIGHSQCGAILAALGDYSGESPAIVRELDYLHLKKSKDLNAGVIENVNNQVNFALKEFKNEIDKNEMVVIGAIYDFRDDFGHGHGRLILMNINGEKSPEKIKKHKYIQGIEHIAIGQKK